MSKEMKEDKLVTIRDFKVMMEGMDMVLGDDWTPTDAQWKRIREKIDAMIDTAERPATITRVYDRGVLPVDPARPSSVDPTLSSTDNELARSFPAVPVAEDVPIGEVAQSALTPPPPAPTVPAGEGEKVHPDNEFV